MSKTKVTVAVKQIVTDRFDGDLGYKVTKVTNALTPKIEDRLDSREIKLLISRGVTVNIT